MKQPRAFHRWWKGIRKKPQPERTQILEKWLDYATRTAAFHSDTHIQSVVYTIRDRFRKSKYKKITRANAQLVFFLTNQHQKNYRRMRNEIRDLKQQLETQPKKPSVVVKKTRNRHIIRSN